MNGDGLRFTLLGPPRVWRGDGELETGAPQQRALLAAVLLRRGRGTAVEDLVAALWEAEPPARAVGTIRTYASRLRRVLERDRGRPEVLVTAGTGYALRVPDAEVDAFAFEERVAAAERARDAGDADAARRLLLEADGFWGGTPLAGLPGPYAAKQRSRLTDLRFSALRTRLELDLDLGRHAEAVGELTLLAHERPWDESVHGLLMLALHRSGRKAEALDVFTRTRRVLASDLGATPGPGLRDLHRRILAEDASLLPVRKDVGAAVRVAPPVLKGAGDVARAGASVPPAAEPGAGGGAWLPSDVPDFTGRRGLVGGLRASLTSAGRGAERRGAPVVVAVSGTGGVGKTALAVHVAHGVGECFPDGRLYADLGGTRRVPAEPGAVLHRFLTALGLRAGEIPKGTAERAALYRSRLADRGVLIVLDDARDLAQIRPLLPAGARCAVLVTSRARLSVLPTDRRVDLAAFERGEALEFLGRVAGAGRVAAEPGAALEAVRLCEGLPLAVRAVGVRLAAGP
ncbi:AfsR/SARP family transcriptional regulator, partial [Actinomadura harenae]